MAVEIIGSTAGAGSFVLDLVRCLAAPIGRPFKYLWNYNTNFINLEKEVDKLKDARVKVQRKVDAAINNVEEIEETVEKWQKDVDSIIGEAEQLIQEKAKNPHCFKGLCPNWITHYKHSKKAFKLKENDISQLLDKEFNEVSYPTNPPEIWLRSNKDYVALESRTSTLKNVRDALNDDNIYMIGVYGMGGLGKTTLVQEVGRKTMEERLFDDMVFIEVTETPNIETIQLKIAKKLGLELDKESEVADKANKLYARLKMSKKDEKGEKGKKDEKDTRPVKILLILDNIWKDLDLATVGIPSGDDRGGCKLLLTTRVRDVLDRMGSTNNFKMGTLNEEEAWNLFQKMAVMALLQNLSYGLM
ncbi:hypothetical protein Pint_21506 [Pistacia integerrima]|uniref:Uncharacterized protein n=1 Tax=Pistacia integerrima TaxID=434235 RepID=A0ACC0XEZ5_9ROSI|nr:hypothetical protein Pint_21506 [Pistacia integerrima]